MDTIGRYQIVKELGRGATGVVYHAIDPAIGRPVAIKTIPFGEGFTDAARERARDRLLREARAEGKLSHPAIITIYDVGQEGGLAYIAMEFIDGCTLKWRLAQPKPVSRRQMFRILHETADGLDYAHQMGIVHRDIKPGNLMIANDGHTKIADFGIARFTNVDAATAQTFAGTPEYMSPEQARGEPVDGRSDQYSLAVIAFEMLTGVNPFTEATLAGVMNKIVHEPTPSARSVNPKLGAEVDRVLSRALEKFPDARYETCKEFVDHLEQACSGSERDTNREKPPPVNR